MEFPLDLKKSIGSFKNSEPFTSLTNSGEMQTPMLETAVWRCFLYIHTIRFQNSLIISRAVLGHKAWLGHSQLEVATEASGLQ